MATFGLMEYAEASPEVRAVYDDIMATFVDAACAAQVSRTEAGSCAARFGTPEKAQFSQRHPSGTAEAVPFQSASESCYEPLLRDTSC